MARRVRMAVLVAGVAAVAAGVLGQWMATENGDAWLELALAGGTGLVVVWAPWAAGAAGLAWFRRGWCRCPDCARYVRVEARVCLSCGWRRTGNPQGAQG